MMELIPPLKTENRRERDKGYLQQSFTLQMGRNEEVGVMSNLRETEIRSGQGHSKGSSGPHKNRGPPSTFNTWYLSGSQNPQTC